MKDLDISSFWFGLLAGPLFNYPYAIFGIIWGRIAE
jgi:hypothetical protein